MGIFKRIKKVMAGSATGRPSSSYSRTVDPTPSIEQERSTSPEMMCGIRPGMTRDEIKSHLAELYRRYNRAASSLDAARRTEAEDMLNAIVVCREKYVG